MTEFNIPDQWSFDAPTVADGFDDHVREQLPFYELATRAVVDLARLHLPRGGWVYDLGASTGNIARAMSDLLDERDAEITGIEESHAMCAAYNAPGSLIQADLGELHPEVESERFSADVVVSFLTLAFLPPIEREQVVQRWLRVIRPGGCLIAVERMQVDGNALAARYLIQAAKLRAGSNGSNVVAKEVSIGGVLRPLPADFFHRFEGSTFDPVAAWQFFSFGDFAGWIIEVAE